LTLVTLRLREKRPTTRSPGARHISLESHSVRGARGAIDVGQYL
jgi:hypothetical protein